MIKYPGSFQNDLGSFWNDLTTPPCDVRPEVVLTSPGGFLGVSERTGEYFP